MAHKLINPNYKKDLSKTVIVYLFVLVYFIIIKVLDITILLKYFSTLVIVVSIGI
ncbi:MAG: hypothetical protein HRU03_07930, partial [Nanoarchaeales archaeon]|nr:hypothetical protein [Nanoarchaeales archaeon]